MSDDRHRRLLGRTLELARRGGSEVIPNPMVGAVIARDGRVIAEGYHARYTEAHAETSALRAAGTRARHATLYCNLEPCSFEAAGKHQPPCTRAIIAAGIRRVAIGQVDPNPHVRGKGVAQLRAAGIQVDVLDDEESWRLNERFNTYMATGRPYVHLKAAVSLDGRIATAGGESKWISDEPARREVHELRSAADAVAVGVGTVLKDDPRLSARDADGAACRRQPRPVVFDSRLRIPPGSFLVRERAADLIVLTVQPCGSGDGEATSSAGSAASRDAAQHQSWSVKRGRLEELGVTVLPVPVADGSGGPAGSTSAGSIVSRRPSVSAGLSRLFDLGIRHVLVEGGGGLITSFLTDRLYDRLTLYVAPFLLGAGYPFAQDLAIDRVEEAIRFEDVRWRTLTDQQVFTAMRAGWLAEVRSAAKKHEGDRAVSPLESNTTQSKGLKRRHLNPDGGQPCLPD